MRSTARETLSAISVVIVDDHEMVRDGLRWVIDAESDMRVVGEADTVERACSVLPQVKPHVAIVDIQLPDGSGVEVCRAVRETAPNVRCLILTSHANDEALFDAVLAGAAGYVLKQIRSQELLSCIRRVASGDSLLDPRSARTVREWASRPDADPLLAALSSQERRLLGLLAQGLTNREIATHMGLSEKTIKNYVSTLLMKLGMSRRSEAAVYATRAAERRRALGPRPAGNSIRY